MTYRTLPLQQPLHPYAFDATSVLTVYVVLLLAIPSPMTVGALGSAGSPSTILAVGALFWWMWFHVHRTRPLVREHQPVRAAALAWLTVMLVVYVNAMSSAIPGDEISPADSGLLKLAGWTGILLVANDGIVNLDRFRTLLRRLVIGVGLVGLFGLFQYVTKQLWVDRLHIPGLSAGTADWFLSVRNGIVRPSGLSTSPIEYGVVLSMVFPLAMVFAMGGPGRRWIYRLALCAISLAILLSISRSALLCSAVGVVVLASSWSASARLKAMAFAGVAAIVVYLASPGVLSTIIQMFTGASDDPSVLSRTGSFDIAEAFINTSPLLGRGFGTFLPRYWILDNGYLGMLIEAGIIGCLYLVFLIITAMWAGRQARRLARSEFDRSVAQAIVAAIAAGASGLAFFDTFAFPQTAGTFFLIIGMAGAALRLNLRRGLDEQPVLEDASIFLPGLRSDEPTRRVAPARR